MNDRFQEPRRGVYSLNSPTLVACPGCGECARTTTVGRGTPDWFTPRRLTCSGCGYSRRWAGREIRRFARWAPIDDYFEVPLWLQTPCCGRVLWAYNDEHLTFIENLVAARLRERARDPALGWSNKSIASRLPRWIKAAENRGQVLRAIGRLRKRLGPSR